MQSRRWTVTVNNYTKEMENVEKLKSLNKLSFIILGREVGREGTPHLQGYVESTKRLTLQSLKKYLLPIFGNCHIENARGSGKENITYCSKEDKEPITIGKMMEQGERTDIQAVKESIDGGISYDDLWDNNFSLMCKYRKAFGEYIDSKAKRRDSVPTVFIFWGEKSGTGKTRDAHAIDSNSWSYPGKGWFDNYRSHKTVIFDEFDGSDLSFALWKKICDRYPIQVPVKGSTANWNPDTIIFTSNVDPKTWFKDEAKPDGWWEQFQRRVTKTTHYQ